MHFNNRYTSDHQQSRKTDKDVFVFTVALQSVQKEATNQFRESPRKRKNYNNLENLKNPGFQERDFPKVQLY